MNERDVKFFRPLWIRIVVTAVVAAWLLFELLVTHEQIWILVALAALAYCGWNLFLKFPKDAPVPPSPPAEPPTQP